MTVNYGNDNDLSKMFKNSKNHYVKRAIIHPDYHSGRNGVGINDIGNWLFNCLLLNYYFLIDFNF